MDSLLTAIIDDDRAKVKRLLKANPSLATRLIEEAKLYQSKIFHWIYIGDTALHLAAAGYRTQIVELLLAAGADPNATANHRKSGPLHYAADGYITGPVWDAKKQVKTIQVLLAAGALLAWRTRPKTPLSSINRVAIAFLPLLTMAIPVVLTQRPRPSYFFYISLIVIAATTGEEADIERATAQMERAPRRDNWV